ncbi:DUF2974 domain-containing protein [Phaeobacter inhibens]|uniref:DUF2974 domain-containing protein n=1 Tax=Phaeobacter inhibens TaxID=221822 RepID=UPI000CA2AF17|nr:DUF2974 domain-containing protein [Phaeobacter inhibens]AUQ66366.1 hypothetical protein PhaeoP78_01499 [Phaeobacter inhibens]
MTLDPTTALQLADLSYNEYGTPSNTPQGWSALVPSVQTETGFTGNAFYNSSSNTLVVGFGGTNDGSDLRADADFTFTSDTDQFNDAVTFTNDVLGNSSLGSNPNVVFVGHSLGGFLAQRAALEYQNSNALVFNSPGIGGFWGGDGTTADNVAYYYSNPDSWNGPSGAGLGGALVSSGNIHNLGDLLNDNVFFILGAEGHSRESLLEALLGGGQIPVSAEQWGAIIAEQLRTGELRPHELVGLMGGQQVFRDTVFQAMRESGTECFGPEVPIDMWPLEPEFAPDPKNPFKQYDQDAVRAKIWKKPIHKIRVGDWVVSHDKDGNMVPGYVPRTMINDAKILLDFHGTRVTPGHVYYRPDSKCAGKYETLIDVLRDDGMIEDRDGVKLRAATYAPVGGPLDKFVQAVTGPLRSDGGVDIKEQGRIRLGTRFIVRNDKGRKDYSVADLIEAGGGVVGDDELIRVGNGPGVPFHWDFGDTLPKPEDFVLACSGTTLEDIYKAAEWESQGPRLPAPMVLDGGAVRPLSATEREAMPRNEPLNVQHNATSSVSEQS